MKEFVELLKLKNGKTLKCTQTKACSYKIRDSFYKHTN